MKKNGRFKQLAILLITTSLLAVTGCSSADDKKTNSTQESTAGSSTTADEAASTTAEDTTNVQSDFSAFLSSLPEYESFLASFYAMSAEEQETIWSEPDLLQGKSVLWKGIVLENRGDSLLLIAADKYAQQDPQALTSTDLPYTFTANGMSSIESIYAGDQVKIHGKVTAKGSNTTGSEAGWELSESFIAE